MTDTDRMMNAILRFKAAMQDLDIDVSEIRLGDHKSMDHFCHLLPNAYFQRTMLTIGTETSMGVSVCGITFHAEGSRITPRR